MKKSEDVNDKPQGSTLPTWLKVPVGDTPKAINTTASIVPLQEEIQKLKNEAIGKATQKGITSSSGQIWKLKELIETIDIEKYIDNHDKLYTAIYRNNADYQAFWIDQREVGFLYEQDIKDGLKLGTDNVQQCVVVMVKGNNQEGRLAALAHIDRFTDSESLKEVFTSFLNVDGISISLYGGRDRSEAQVKISDSNIDMVMQVITKKGYESKIQKLEVPGTDQPLLGNSNTSSEVIFDPQNNTIIQGQYASKGYETKDIRLIKRRVADKGASYDGTVEIKRDKKLEKVDLQECEKPIIFNNKHFDDELAKLCIADYCDGGYDKMLQKLDNASSDNERATICSQEFKPFLEGVYHSLQKLGYPINDKKLIYNGQALAQISANGELQEKLQESFAKLKDIKEDKEQKIPAKKRKQEFDIANFSSKDQKMLEKAQNLLAANQKAGQEESSEKPKGQPSTKLNLSQRQLGQLDPWRESN